MVAPDQRGADRTTPARDRQRFTRILERHFPAVLRGVSRVTVRLMGADGEEIRLAKPATDRALARPLSSAWLYGRWRLGLTR
jgi:hypothetical protein